MNTEIIRSKIADMLETLTVAYDSIDLVPSPVGSKETFVIKTPEPNILIGDNGETLQAFSHILKRIVHKELGEDVDFSLDINEYRAHKAEELKIKARMLAQRARDMKIDVEMEPMSSYERLIVHDALAGQEDVSTDSAGEGYIRHVVIHYKG